MLATSSLDGEASLLLKRLSKKDTVTKLKALDELLAAVGANDASWAEAFLPHGLAPRLASDVARRVRERAWRLGALAALLRKQLAPQLKRLVAVALRVRPAARRAPRGEGGVAARFPNAAKDAEVLVHCRDELIRGPAEVARSAAAEVRRRRRRRRGGARPRACRRRGLPGCGARRPRRPRRARRRARLLLDDELLAAETRRFGGAKAAGVRAAAYALAQACLEAAGEAEGDALHRLSVLLLDGLGEKEPSCHRALWPLLLLRAEPAAVRAALAPKHVIARLVLRAGCHGAAHGHHAAPISRHAPRRALPPGGGGGGGGAAARAGGRAAGGDVGGARRRRPPSAHFGAPQRVRRPHAAAARARAAAAPRRPPSSLRSARRRSSSC